MPRLKVLSPKVALEMEFDRAITLGRHISNSVPIPDTEVSRRHAQIFPREGKFLIADLASRNGVFVNGEKAKERELEEGDEIAVGMTLAFFDPPEKGDVKNLLSPRGSVLWRKMPRERSFLPFEITTCSRGELDDVVTTWLGRAASSSPLAQNQASQFLEFVLGSDRWTTRNLLAKGTLEFVRERIGGARLAILSTDAKKRDLQVQALVGGGSAKDFEIGKDVLRIVVDGERGVYCGDCGGDFRFTRLVKQSGDSVGSFLAAPIYCKDKYSGFLYADHPPSAGFYDFKSLVQAYVAGAVFGRCLHWLQVGRARPREE